MSKTKLELTWIGKNERKKLEPRILLEDPSKSYHASQKVTDNDIFDNKLIFGDNLLALKALEQEYAGKVKCVFIDPPYNTGSAFEHYDDGVEHSIWLTLMRDRLEIIRNLLSDDGSLWITIDDNEAHYLKVMCDEIFGRPNFIANAIWEKSDSPRMDANFFSSRHDHILVYAKDINSVVVRKQKLSLSDLPKHYNKVDEEGKPYYLKPLRAMGQADRREDRPSMFYPILAPDGQEIFPKKQDGSDGRWRWAPKKVEEELWRIEWTNTKGNWSPNFRVYADNSGGRPPETIWFNSEVGSNRTSKAEIKKVIKNVTAFDTPKPEALIQKIIEISTEAGDIVLDSFAGSGTTGAVAHKMGRRWIMVELGEHCHTHIIPRLQKVIDGEDQGGISKAVNWQGGGGFRYHKLAPSLIVKDKFGLEVINKEYNPEMLAEAVCKLEGFTYAPSVVDWWDHGYSTETDHIYVTTQSLSVDKLEALSEEVGSDRTLLVMCGAFRCETGRFANLTLKKLPKAILDKCQFGQDDYSLNVANLTDEATDDIEQEQD
ncbi:site-specific DNA-methyltransferase [Vibrio parahaemolyticus]|uniref:site-specific DNA-methyltransferase n=1 Tax=Vibrio parahaemolyticus TaxID=670 RepID=UPI0008D94F9A|nr:site-specific DNA-methyltransferase [Vibrio parahaemolyticus]MBY8032297.1 site-specific DNA-methyltransferase [Vibrio fluvialis]EJG1884651.1 site-specific DNA-methyltransferase [Vibrio parahaemolyticus]ELA9445949.1 site-specific DNA-methyltransferase [Vibrio parahaemolyticus]ELB2164347.1 site-specific DNA-methyltransferase [Vibrio parahaemolyticus]MBY8191787.1 site-specific DNA-methyltransferase [Vibrio fluvialis]